MNGKSIRLSRIFDRTTKKTVIVPLDNTLLSGPEGGLRNIEGKINQVVAGRVNAILGFYGLFLRHSAALDGVPGIMNVTASTKRQTHTRKVIVGSVEQAVAMGMDGVAVHVNVSSHYESEMLKILADISRDCVRFGMPLIAIMYPRAEGNDGTDENYYNLLRNDPDQYAELVRHSVRIAVDLGADMVKTQYTGSIDSFRTVVESASGVPVVMAGGARISDKAILQNAHDVIRAGAAGVCVGRNVFDNDLGKEMTMALRLIVHEGVSVERAIKSSGLSGL
jgi:DhnA family fructose-bisphosphate aldolase class Ia